MTAALDSAERQVRLVILAFTRKTHLRQAGGNAIIQISEKIGALGNSQPNHPRFFRFGYTVKLTNFNWKGSYLLASLLDQSTNLVVFRSRVNLPGSSKSRANFQVGTNDNRPRLIPIGSSNDRRWS